jgi:hypothetical protein
MLYQDQTTVNLCFPGVGRTPTRIHLIKVVIAANLSRIPTMAADRIVK